MNLKIKKDCYERKIFKVTILFSDPKGIRTPITAVKGRGPNH